MLAGEFTHHFHKLKGGGRVEAIGGVIEAENTSDGQQEAI